MTPKQKRAEARRAEWNRRNAVRYPSEQEVAQEVAEITRETLWYDRLPREVRDKVKEGEPIEEKWLYI